MKPLKVNRNCFSDHIIIKNLSKQAAMSNDLAFRPLIFRRTAEVGPNRQRVGGSSRTIGERRERNGGVIKSRMRLKERWNVSRIFGLNYVTCVR